MTLLAASAAVLFFGNGIITQVRGYALSADSRSLPVAGIQLEFPNEQQVLSALNQARAKFPETQLFMLSEYTFQEPVPQRVRNWCASNHVWLVVGGKEPLGDTNFYNMAYVVGTNGAIVHRQVKSVPIQFFKDGLPAPERRVWDSPWGKVGILTCYDLSYTRVVDDFVRQGAVALLNPTMDVSDWGEGEHRLHSYVAPLRAAEYGIPIFRVASSGISQLVDRTGQVLAAAPFPGEDAIVGGKLPLNARPRLPLDRSLAPLCVVLTALVLVAALIPQKLFRVHSRSFAVRNSNPC
jgi:apolipoprotein N-acyltransferase